MARTGRLKKICNHACRVAGALQKTPPSEILEGQGADFLRGVAIGSIMTGAALRTTWHQFFVAGAILYTDGVEKSQNALVRGRQLCTQLSIFEGVSLNA